MLGYGWASSDASAKGDPNTATADVNGVSVGVQAVWFDVCRDRRLVSLMVFDRQEFPFC